MEVRTRVPMSGGARDHEENGREHPLQTEMRARLAPVQSSGEKRSYTTSLLTTVPC